MLRQSQVSYTRWRSNADAKDRTHKIKCQGQGEQPPWPKDLRTLIHLLRTFKKNITAARSGISPPSARQRPLFTVGLYDSPKNRAASVYPLNRQQSISSLRPEQPNLGTKN